MPDLLEIPLGNLYLDPDNPRVEVGDTSGLEASIRELGQLDPLLVRPAPEEGEDCWYVIDGQRRLHALHTLAQPAATAVPVETLEQRADRIEAALVKNLQRRELSPIDEALAFQKLLGLGRTQTDLAHRLGVSQPYVSRRVALLKLPPKVQDAVRRQTVTLDAADELAKAKNPAVVQRVANVMAEGADAEKVAREVRKAVDQLRRQRDRDAAKAAHDDLIARLHERGLEQLPHVPGDTDGLVRCEPDEAAATAFVDVDDHVRCYRPQTEPEAQREAEDREHAREEPRAEAVHDGGADLRMTAPEETPDGHQPEPDPAPVETDADEEQPDGFELWTTEFAARSDWHRAVCLHCMTIVIGPASAGDLGQCPSCRHANWASRPLRAIGRTVENASEGVSDDGTPGDGDSGDDAHPSEETPDGEPATDEAGPDVPEPAPDTAEDGAGAGPSSPDEFGDYLFGKGYSELSIADIVEQLDWVGTTDDQVRAVWERETAGHARFQVLARCAYHLDELGPVCSDCGCRPGDAHDGCSWQQSLTDGTYRCSICEWVSVRRAELDAYIAENPGKASADARSELDLLFARQHRLADGDEVLDDGSILRARVTEAA